MRILVTGRHGQVAQSLAERAQAHQLVFAARPEFDLGDAASIEAMVVRVHPDLIVSAAAFTAVDKAEDEPELAMRVNGEGPAVLAHAAHAIGAPLIHLSTDYVFDGGLDRPWREDDPVGPLGVYGETKLMGERGIAATNARYAILRTSWVYSPFGHNFVKTILRLAQGGGPLRIVDDQFGCPTSAGDIADALLRIAEAWRADATLGTREIYHLAGPDAVSWADFAREILNQGESMGGPGAEVIGIAGSAYPTRATRPRNSRLDSSKFAGVFGYHAPPLRTSLAAVLVRLFASVNAR